MCRLSVVVANRDCSLLLHMSFSLQLLLLFRSTGSRLVDFGICGVWTQKLCYMGLFVPWPVGSSWARD